MNRNLSYGLMGWMIASCCAGAAFGQAVRASSSLSLNGESSGGVLTLMLAPGANYPYVAVTNKPGEPAASVLGRLASELANHPACAKYYGKEPVREITGNTIVLPGGRPEFCPTWILGGTESGFSIPLPPTCVSASYDSQRVALEWVNSPTGYDSISVLVGGIPLVSLPGNTTRYVHDWKVGGPLVPRSDDVVYLVMGCKAGTPSNGAGVRLRSHVQQESLMNVPFTRGIAPGFRIWTHNTPAGAMSFEQGNLPEMGPGLDGRKFNGRGFYQVIQGSRTFCGGVSRRFLGLAPGHTYRVRARLNTLEAKKEGSWSLSFHAAYNPPTGQDLTSAQMAGVAELPDKSLGPTAGQIARCDASTTTDAAWIVRASDATGPGQSIGDITLPKGVSSITVWFRHDGTDVSGTAVALDSVSIEDITK